jgi:hypothetical protein
VIILRLLVKVFVVIEAVGTDHEVADARILR